MPIQRALISVSDKEGVAEFAKGLEDLGVEILSTGGTAKVLKEAGIKVVDVANFTGFPEMMGGRVKTLHPKVHGGILALRSDSGHMSEAQQNDVEMIDMVVVNLYPFQETVAKEGVSEEEAIENIDIGGPSMIRSAAKNFKFVTVVTDKRDYSKVLEELVKDQDTSLETRKRLARKAFNMTFNYDEAIEHYFRESLGEPELLDLHYEKVSTLRYGENPHQKAAFFRDPANRDSNIPNSKVLHGKQLSFNNLVDSDSALDLVMEFSEPAAVFVKHNNPCGVASAATIEEAFELAHQVDPLSAFGSVIAVNRELNEKMVDYIKQAKIFVEIIIAPSFEEKALKRLKTRENLRILEVGKFKSSAQDIDIKTISGGLLIQTKDGAPVEESDLKVVTKKKPSAEEIEGMLFANKVCKHVMSNAVVMAKGSVVTGIGAGQMSRVDSVRIAGFKGGDKMKGSVMASDAFLPFADALELAVEYGVTALIQPGGSMRDDEVIKRADELGIAMVFSGKRYFRH